MNIHDRIDEIRDEYSYLYEIDKNDYETYRKCLAYLMFELMLIYGSLGFQSFTHMLIASYDDPIYEGCNYIKDGIFYFDFYRGRYKRYSKHKGLITSEINLDLSKLINIYLKLREKHTSDYFLVDYNGVPIVRYHNSYCCRLLYEVIGISIYDIKILLDDSLTSP
jgi:hypothetical protein